MSYIPECVDDEAFAEWKKRYPTTLDTKSDNPTDWMRDAWMEAVRILVDQYCITRANVAKNDSDWGPKKPAKVAWDG